MIRYYVAYSVGAVCDHSSESACPQCKKPDHQVGLCDLAVRETAIYKFSKVRANSNNKAISTLYAHITTYIVQ
jgi:hypothetical protein